jgi:non-reducing end alpha-L-arabinofuranosidase
MKTRKNLLAIIVAALIIPAGIMIAIATSCSNQQTIASRPEGPCDIYAADGAPCVAAHSSTRALYASYNGPLYQVMRMSDSKTLDVGVVQPSAGDPGGYADAAAQDKFCADTYCWITTIYDQSGMGNHLVQAPRGAFIGTAMGGFNNIPIADMAPINLMGHKVYGVFITPDMGLRWNDAKGTAVDDQAEGQYWVINGHHYNDGCCFDYGNAETDSRDDGDGTMETTYYGNASLWYYGEGEGPWIMTDQENNLVGCVNPSPFDKYCPDLPSITWRFVTATADGKPGGWRMMGGDAQEGDLEILFDGPRIINDRSSYDPMRKQGAIVLGNGGDNNNYSQGTFYEGAMTAPGTYPSVEACQKIQKNIVSARYNVATVSISPASATDIPTGLQTFAPKSTQSTTVTFTNTSESPVKGVELSISVPQGWKAVVSDSQESVKKFSNPIEPNETVTATFTVTSGSKTYNGDIVGMATWTDKTLGKKVTETAAEKVRNVSPVKINEFQVGGGTNLSDTFIELYNAGDSEVEISNWTLTQHPTQLPVFSSIVIPAGTKLAPHDFYVFGLSTSGLAVPVQKGESTIYLRSVTGMSVGDEIEIGTGSKRETRKITGISEPPKPAEQAPARMGWGRASVTPGTPTTVWQPIPDGPVITIPKGSNNIPVASVSNIEVGQKIAIGYGATYPTVAQSIEKYEVVTVTNVGKPGTQAWLSMDAKAGDRNIKVSSVENISVGDKIRLDIESQGYGIEWVTVTRVGTASSRNTFAGPLTENDDPGTGLDLAEPLKFNHASNMPFSARGTGITFEPATAFDHSSNEPVLALCFSVTLDKALDANHEINSVVLDRKVTTAGYQGSRTPDQWFGGPALSFFSGNMVLRDEKGNVVDGLNYGELVDPWASEGYQAVSGAGEFGCFTPSPAMSSGSSRIGATPASLPKRSVGRFPDGLDNDSNCNDFVLPTTTTLASSAKAGSKNIKVINVPNFTVGQQIVVGIGADSENVTIAAVGTAGGTRVTAATKVGATVIPVENITGFSAGQTITIGSGENMESVVVASTTNRRFGFGRPQTESGPTTFITVTSPTKKRHNVDEEVAGSGISFENPLSKEHAFGVQIASNIPTPGAPNKF